jgi:PAS domain S-box-containing protein/putative nucleotidyltransferase with HDIG domain
MPARFPDWQSSGLQAMKVKPFWSLIDQVASPVLILDDQAVIQHANPAFLQLLERTPEDNLDGVDIRTCLPADQQGIFQEFFDHIAESLSPLEIDLINRPGTTRRVQITAKIITEMEDTHGYTVLTLNEIGPQSRAPGIDQHQITYEDLQWLADQGRVLLTCDNWDDILETASQALHQKLSDTLVLCLTMHDEDNLRLEGIFGLENSLVGKVFNLVGGDLVGRHFPVDERFRETYSKRRLYKHPGNLGDFARSQVSDKVSHKLESLLGIEDIYTIGLESNLGVLGCLYILTRQPDLELPENLIESYIFQVALALEKTRISRNLEKSQHQFQTIFEHAPDGYYLTDMQGNFLNGNLATERITGYQRSEIIGRNMMAVGLISGDQVLKAGKLLANNLLGKSTGPDEFELTRRDGSTISVEITTHPVTMDNRSVVLGIARDISDRKSSEEELQQAHNNLTRVLEGIDAHVYVADLNSCEILYMNKRMIEDFGGDFTGKVCHKVFVGNDERCDHCTKDQLVDDQGHPGGVIVWEGYNEKAQGWYKNYDRAIYWTDQRVVKLQIAIDVSDSIQASRALRESEKRYRALFENSLDALMTISPPDWRFTSANEAMLELFNIESKSQFLELNPWQLSPEYQPDGRSSAEKAAEQIQIAIEEGSNFFQWTHKKISGEEFNATVQLSRVDTDQDFFVQATVVDITDQIAAGKTLHRQMEELSLLNRINQEANQGRPLREILNLFGEETQQMFKAMNVRVSLLNEKHNALEMELLSAHKNLLGVPGKVFGKSGLEQLQLDLRSNNPYRDLVKSGTAQVISNLSEIQDLVQAKLRVLLPEGSVSEELRGRSVNLVERTGIKSLAVAPLISEGKITGLVELELDRIFPAGELVTLSMLSDQLSGIISRNQSDRDRMDHLNELELISRSLQDSTREGDLDLLCNRLADNVLRVVPEAYVMVSLYDPELNAIRLRALKGLGGVGSRLAEVLGKRPEEITIDVEENPLDRELNRLFTSGKLEKVPGGLYDLTRGVLPQRVCRMLEKIAGVKEVYIAGFGLQEKSTGGLTLLIKEGGEIKYPEAIETVANHYAVIFERRIVQEEILLRKAQLEAVREVGLSIASQLNLDQLLSTIAGRAQQIVDAAACGFSIFNPERNVLEYLAYTGNEQLPKNTNIKYGEGLSGKVWKTKQTIQVVNYAEWEGRAEGWDAVGHYNLTGIPVIWGDDFLGVLEIATNKRETLTPAEIQTLELFATQAAIAIKNARLYAEEKLRRQEAENLREVGMLINRMIDREDLLTNILSSLINMVPYQRASIQLVKGAEIVVEAFVGGNDPERVIGTSYSINDNPVAQRILYQGEQIILGNKKEIDQLLTGPEMENIQSWMGVPLEIKGDRIGIMTLDHNSPQKYTKQDASLLKDFATQASIALENNRMFDEIRRRTREIEVVYDSALKLTRELQPGMLFEYLYQQVDSLFDLDGFILATYQSEEDVIQVEFATEAGEQLGEARTPTLSAADKNSLLSWIVRKKSSLRIGNVVKDSLPFPPRQDDRRIRSWLGVPLLVGDRVIGALVVQSYRSQAYSEDNQRLLELLANQAAVALENSQLWEDAQMRLSRLISLREIDMAISGSVDLEMTMQVLLGQLLETLNVDAACVLAYNPNQQTLEYLKAIGFRTKSLQRTSLRIGEGLAGKAALERKLIHIPDLDEEQTSLKLSAFFNREGFVTYLVQPLITKGELVGVLEVFHREQLDPDPEWINFLDALARMAGIAIDRLNMFNNLTRSNVELQQAYDATIQGWARAIELRDVGTSEHSQRVTALTMNLARKLGIQKDALIHIRRGAMLHDIGKMAVSDGILLKRGSLSDDEWELMKKHPQYAYDMLSSIEYLRPAMDIPYSHHERWDGSGYPRGLAGEEIPLAARIFAVVDVWDALQSDRPYRDAWTEEAAIEYLEDQKGKEFDPRVVDAFLELIEAGK